jgi:hypothetical protein
MAADAVALAQLGFARQQRTDRIRAAFDSPPDLFGERQIAGFALRARRVGVRGLQMSPRAMPPSTSMDGQFT